jgi:transposase
MRGADAQPGSLFSYVALEDRIPADHPLRVMRALIDPLLVALSPRFDDLYSPQGRRSIAPEKLLRALLLQVLYTIRSERQLMEQLDYNLLFRWFVGLGIDDPIWVPTVFTKNRDRLLAGHIADALLHEVLRVAHGQGLLSHEHFTVDGTLLEAWASHKSFRRKEGGTDAAPPPEGGSNPSVNFRGERRSNATHASTTDPDARLARKSHQTAAILAYQASVLLDNRHGLVVGTHITQPGYPAEGDAALELLTQLEPRARRRTLGADKGYDRAEVVAGIRALGVTPHITPNVHRTKPTSVIDERTTRHPGYAISQRKRKLVEQGFGWSKVIGLLRKLRHRGLERVSWIFTCTNAVYNLVRLRTLIGQGVCP